MGGQKTMGAIHNEAFEFLKKNYKVMWLISLCLYGVQMVLGIVMSIFTVPLNIFANLIIPFTLISSGEGSPESLLARIGPVLVIFLVLMGAVFLIALAVAILENAAYIGVYDATLQSLAGDKPVFGQVWSRFSKNWKRFVGVVAWAMLWRFLWSLLFFVPGVIKSYSYRLAPLLVLQHPEMTIREALKKSKEMTRGYKGRLFGIDVILFLYGLASLVGLCLIVGTLAIEILWLIPMIFLMRSIAYLDIKQAAIEKGLLPQIQ